LALSADVRSSGAWIAVVNPVAGGERCGRAAASVLRSLRTRLDGAGETLEIVYTGAAGDATRLAREAFGRGARRFLAVGGDGTAFEVLNGLFPEAKGDPRSVVLGFLPLGTGNSFVRDFSRDGVAYCLDALVAGRRRNVDLLRVRHQHGELMALGAVSLGYGAAVAALVNRRLKRFGKLGYSLGVLAEVARLAPGMVRLAVDGGEARTESLVLLCACNNQYVGGDMRMAPDAVVDDGLLDLVTVGPVGRFDLVRTFPRIFAGTHLEHPAVMSRRTRAVELDLPAQVDVMIDGESLRMRIERVEVVPAAITVAL
jgi:diacylglycerol kinase (ATP)